MVRTLLFIFGVWLLFTVFVTVFAASANKNEVRTLPKWLWILICAGVPFIGGLLYLVLGRPLGPPKQRYRKTKSVAPDDDPAFLRDLADKLDTKDEDPAKDKPEDTPEDKPEEDSGPSPEPKDKS
ncbi:MAG: PLD nuclease N-terminal domain-containing protein [Rhodoluna sp.]